MPRGVRGGLHLGVGVASLVSEGASATLRPMRESDLLQVVSIERDWAPKPWSVDTFRNELGIPFSRALVAHDAGAPGVVGGYLVRWLVAGEVHLLSLAVERHRRRHGIGSFLLDVLLAEARAESADLVTLEVEASNVSALRLYESRGFARARTRRNYYGGGRDAVVMDRRLGCRDVS